nr:reverse transcriptase domain-containing protein [Tanacetum cinerariifolium]
MTGTRQPYGECLASILICTDIAKITRKPDKTDTRMERRRVVQSTEEINGLKKKSRWRAKIGCMRTRNFYFPNNSSVTIPRRQNKRRTPNIVEPELRTIVEMADNRTMDELLQAPTEGEEYAQEIFSFSNKSLGGNPILTFEPILFYSSPSLTPFEGSDFILEEINAYLKDESISSEIDHVDCDLEGDICLIEKLLNDDPFQLLPMDLKQGEVVKAKSSIEEPPKLELKELPSHLEYAYLEAVAATDDSLVIPEHTTVETPMNISPANKAHFEAEKEAIHLILTGIGDEIYSTVDACQTAQEMWEAIKRLQQGESLNIQDVKTNLLWEFGSPVVQKSEIQCFNCKKFGHFAKECRKPKRVKDSAYHKENMLLCKQAEQRVPLQAEQYDWLADTDEEIDEQELEAHYCYMAKIQEVPTTDTGTDFEPLEKVQNDVGYNLFANNLQHSEQSESISNTCLVETDDSNVIPDSPDICVDDIQNDQNDVESDDERVVLANLIDNLKLDVDENKRIHKQLKKANTTLAQELKECKTILAETSKTLGESISVRDSCLVALQNKQTEFEKYKAFNDRTVDYDKLE